jgi:hypothetical protein
MKPLMSAPNSIGAAPCVGETRRAVGSRRHLGWPSVVLCLGLSACSASPEQRLVGRWRESQWRYEKLGRFELASLPTDRDDPALPALLRHEAEHWEFRGDGALVMRRAGGAQRVARWRLKGRGHLLVLDSARASEREVYEIKELRAGQLVLHYDIGLEVRGIARLTFTRLGADAEPAELAGMTREGSSK